MLVSRFLYCSLPLMRMITDLSGSPNFLRASDLLILEASKRVSSAASGMIVSLSSSKENRLIRSCLVF